MGFVLNDKAVGDQAELKGKTQKSVNEKFAWRLGENDTIFNLYNEAILSIGSGGIDFALAIRVFDGSIAFRYEITQPLPSAENRITKEITQFNFPRNLYTLSIQPGIYFYSGQY